MAMDEYPKPNLIVGGPHDGQRYTVNGPELVLPVWQPVVPGVMTAAEIIEYSPINRAFYVPFFHGLGKHRFCVWVPIYLTEEEARELVFGRIADAWAREVGQ